MDTQQTPQQERSRRSLRVQYPTEEPLVTYILIGILVLVHLYIMGLNARDQSLFYADYANIASQVADGQFYRLFTAMFLHADLTHLAFNCFALYIFGRDVERLFGHVRFLIVFFLGGLLGSVASFVITQASSVGASGAVFAIFGALVVYLIQNRSLYPDGARRQLQQLAIIAAVNLGIGFISNVPGSPVRIDNAAHIGGALGGAMLAWFMAPHFQVQRTFDGQQFQLRLVDQRQVAQWVFVPIALAGFIIVITAYVMNARA